ncbi:hypothetical protein [Yoonia sp. R2-816]|uniref:hypothetical protein n=1 Tax=Yoonia sp. R2-816 TaxID=3342638 RepID=UPI00372C8EF9
MDTTLALPPKNVATVAYVPEQMRVQDRKVPVVKELDRGATLPSDKMFVAQVVNARLSGTEFPENPGEIAPPERTLRPYSVPMLPFDKEEPEVEVKDDGTVDAATPADAQIMQPEQQVAAIEDDVVPMAQPTADQPTTNDTPVTEEPEK